MSEPEGIIDFLPRVIPAISMFFFKFMSFKGMFVYLKSEKTLNSRTSALPSMSLYSFSTLLPIEFSSALAYFAIKLATADFDEITRSSPSFSAVVASA